MQKILTEEEAIRMFLDTRFYGKYRLSKVNGAAYGLDLKQLLVWHMRQFIPKHAAGVEREKERRDERERLVRNLTKPWSKRKFIKTIEYLICDLEKAINSGLCSRGNPGMAELDELPKSELDETIPAGRAIKYGYRLIQAANIYPWLFYKILVFGYGFKEWRWIKDEKGIRHLVQYRPLGYYQK